MTKWYKVTVPEHISIAYAIFWCKINIADNFKYKERSSHHGWYVDGRNIMIEDESNAIMFRLTFV